MTRLIDLQFSELGVLEVLAAGILLFAVFRLLYRIVTMVPPSRARTVIHRLFPTVETVGWLFYAIWSAGNVLTDPFYHALATLALLAILAVWVSWFALKDWIAGVILKVQDVYETDQYIQVGDIRGRIVHIGYLSLEIEQENGDRAKIPYGKISGQIYWKHHPEALSNYYRFQVTIPRNVSIAEAMTDLRTAILSSPWSSPQREPQISVLRETDQAYVFEAVVYAPHRTFVQSIEEDVKREYPEYTIESVKVIRPDQEM